MQGTRLTLSILILVAFLGAIAYYALSRPPEERVALTTLDAYFEERLTTLGVEDIGQPIEGFDAHLLTSAFPGILAEDFEGVETLEGYYVVSGSGVSFVRREGAALFEEGVDKRGLAMIHVRETLLDNISVRLGIEPVATSSVDAILLAINTAERFEARIGQGGSAFGVTVVPETVLEDSRCPVDVTCIQAGTVRLRAELVSALGKGKQIFILGEPVTTEAEEVTLLRVNPEPRAGAPADPDDYRFVFEVKKRR